MTENTKDRIEHPSTFRDYFKSKKRNINKIGSTSDKNSALVSADPGFSILRTIRTVGENIYLVFNAIAGIGTPVAIFAALGITGTAALINRIGSGDHLATILGVVSTTALMAGSLSAAFLVHKNQNSKHQDKMEKFMDNFEQNTLDDKKFKITIARILDDIGKSLEHIREEIAYQNENKPLSNEMAPNNAATWSRLAPGTRYIGVGGIAQNDITERRNGDGELRYQANGNRLKVWLPRSIGETKLGRIDLIFLQRADYMDNELVLPSGLKRVIAAYMAARQIAENSGLGGLLDYSNVNVHLMPADYQISNAFFVGEKILTGQKEKLETAQFVLRYDAFGQIASSITDKLNPSPKVNLSFDKEEVESCRKLADLWILETGRSFKMDELIQRVKNQIPLDACDYVLSDEDYLTLNLPIPGCQESSESHIDPEIELMDRNDGTLVF